MRRSANSGSRRAAPPATTRLGDVGGDGRGRRCAAARAPAPAARPTRTRPRRRRSRRRWRPRRPAPGSAPARAGPPRRSRPRRARRGRTRQRGCRSQAGQLAPPACPSVGLSSVLRGRGGLGRMLKLLVRRNTGSTGSPAGPRPACRCLERLAQQRQHLAVGARAGDATSSSVCAATGCGTRPTARPRRISSCWTNDFITSGSAAARPPLGAKRDQRAAAEPTQRVKSQRPATRRPAAL